MPDSSRSGVLDSFFKINARGSSTSTEITGGLTTFLTMAYIVAVNPIILQAGGMPFSAALTATCFGAAVMTIAMGLIANRPLALASGMGINAIVAYSICLGLSLDWRVGMAVVFLEGVVILLLVLCGLREAIMRAIPVSLRRAIGIGIGLFIAFIGLQAGSLIVVNDTTLVTMGDIKSPAAIVALVSIAVACITQVRHIRGGLIISVLVAVIVGIPLGVTTLPTSWNFGLDFSALAAPFQSVTAADGTASMAIVQVLVQPVLLLYAFSLMMSDFFDTMGGVMAIGAKADFVDENGDVADIGRILLVDSAAAAVGGFIGASSITTYIESASGASEGARTGLSSLVVGVLFIVCAFLAPIVGMISETATCGALIVVGYLMMTDVTQIEWKDITLALPAFVTIICIPMTYSITDGIGLGFLSYVVMMLFSGKAKQIHPLMWASSAVFLLAFLLM